MSETPMTPEAARVRLAQYGERTKTWSTATYADGTERALHEIALTLNAEAAGWRAKFQAQWNRAETLDRLLREAQDRLAEYERPADEDPIAYTLTEQAAPDFFQPGHTYADPDPERDWAFRVDTVTVHPETGKRTALGWRHFRGTWEAIAYDEDDYEIHQHVGITDATEPAAEEDCDHPNGHGPYGCAGCGAFAPADDEGGDR
ncbi:hypothetical protein [Streptomyces sp. enrichment culture]|uniref:hypothetical protein n=1 Tax=Streptomyces sp. enrichment culture TaxID=1795815 RepID=UPI003F543BCE